MTTTDVCNHETRATEISHDPGPPQVRRRRRRLGRHARVQGCLSPWHHPNTESTLPMTTTTTITTDGCNRETRAIGNDPGPPQPRRRRQQPPRHARVLGCLSQWHRPNTESTPTTATTTTTVNITKDQDPHRCRRIHPIQEDTKTTARKPPLIPSDHPTVLYLRIPQPQE